jgi:predicted nucleic acid-binding protein
LRFVDTNVLLYSISTAADEARKHKVAIEVLNAADLALSVQVLQEFYVQATRSTRADAIDPAIAAGLVRAWIRFTLQDITLSVMLDALTIAQSHRLSYWDAAIVAAARALGCSEVLTEDLSHGQSIEGVLINNPFREA